MKFADEVRWMYNKEKKFLFNHSPHNTQIGYNTHNLINTCWKRKVSSIDQIEIKKPTKTTNKKIDK